MIFFAGFYKHKVDYFIYINAMQICATRTALNKTAGNLKLLCVWNMEKMDILSLFTHLHVCYGVI